MLAQQALPSQAAGLDPKQYTAIADIVCSILWECPELYQNWRIENGVKETVGGGGGIKPKQNPHQSCTFGFKWKRCRWLFQDLVARLLFAKKEISMCFLQEDQFMLLPESLYFLFLSSMEKKNVDPFN